MPSCDDHSVERPMPTHVIVPSTDSLMIGTFMNRYAALSVVTFVTLAGCGDVDGIRAQGSISLTVHQTGERDGTAGFNLPADTLIDAPPGAGQGFYGTCTRTGNRWNLDIGRADASIVGLRRVVFSGTEGSTSGAVNTKFTLGTTDFSGTSECTASALSIANKGLRFTATCTGMRANNDLRTVDATINVTLTQCNVQ
jgi:hypothetical protein